MFVDILISVLDLTIRLAEVMLSSGSGTADIVATAQDVAQAYRPALPLLQAVARKGA